MKFKLVKTDESEQFSPCWKVISNFFEQLLVQPIWTEDSGKNNQYRIDCEYLEFEKICYYYGMSKIAFFSEGVLVGNWIMKMPIDFTVQECKEDYDILYPSLDYCKIEENNWKSARENRVSDYFAETHCIGEAHLKIEGLTEKYKAAYIVIPLYAQRCVDCGHEWDNRADHSEIDADRIDSLYESCEDCGTDDILVDALIDTVGIDEVQKVMEFITCYNINDIHNSNWGFLNGRPCVFDFSGYVSRS